MKKLKKIILIPVYNDWKSLNKLLNRLDLILKRKYAKIEILIINDNSSEKIKLPYKKFNCLKVIRVLSLNKNCGSQRAIYIGLNFLKKIKNNFVVTIMDSDGEDDPAQVPKMFKLASANPNYVVTSNRKKRKESKLVILLYRIHLLITFLFTLKWVSFGNFTTFNKKNLYKILSDRSSILAHSSSVLKNCKIIKLHAKRKKRYFDKSKLSLFSLIEHSLRINAVFQKNVLFLTLLYSSLILLLIKPYFSYLLLFPILIFNLFVFIVKIKFLNFKLNNRIHSIKSFKTG